MQVDEYGRPVVPEVYYNEYGQPISAYSQAFRQRAALTRGRG